VTSPTTSIPLDLGRIDSALFDLDGVIADSREPFTRSVNATLLAHGLEPRPEQELHEYLGPPTHATFEAILGEEPGERVDAIVRAYRAHYREQTMLQTPVFAGVAALVEDLARRIPLVVATSKARVFAEELLGEMGLASSFLAIVGPELESVNEPKTETVARALDALPAQAQAPVMIGDRRYDVIAARAHGVPTIGVLWGIGSERELREAGAAVLVASPAELARLLRAAPDALAAS